MYQIETMEDKPTLNELLTHVDVGTDWLRLGVLLELDMKDLRAIEHERHTIDQRLQCMYDLWLKTNPKATRDQLMKALGIMRANTLADKYKKWISTTARPTATSRHTDTRKHTPSVSKQTTAQQTLDITHLQKVLNLLRDAHFNGDWEGLGLQLGLYQHPTLSNIQHTNGGRGAALRECLASWLQRADGVDKNGGANYVSLANAVERLDQKAAADHIRRECQIDTGQEETLIEEIGESFQGKPLPVQEDSYISEEEEEKQSSKDEDEGGGGVRHRSLADPLKQQQVREKVPPQKIKKGSSCNWKVLGGVAIVVVVFGLLVGKVYANTTEDISLDITNLQEILDVLKEGLFPDNRWLDLGLNLSLTHNDLAVIEEDRPYAHRRMQEMLSIWLRRGRATWSKLAKALDKIDEYKAAKIVKARVKTEL